MVMVEIDNLDYIYRLLVEEWGYSSKAKLTNLQS